MGPDAAADSRDRRVSSRDDSGTSPNRPVDIDRARSGAETGIWDAELGGGSVFVG